MSDSMPPVADLQKELAARYANLFMICYKRSDISGMHITFTAFTHVLHTLKLWENKRDIMQQMRGYILHEGFPEAEVAALDWLLNHYFEQPQDNEEDETVLLPWYQSLDDEWVLRKKLRNLFPEHSNTQLTLLIADQLQKQTDA